LKALLSHKIPDGDLAAVLREAIRCGIEKHGKRKGANRKGAPAPAQKWQRRVSARAAERSPSRSSHVPASVRRQVWKRDGGSCTWTSDDGRRCGSRWQVEIDHILPPPLGGSSELENLRLRCRGHNMLYAEEVYGREHMDQFRREKAPVVRDGDVLAWGGAAPRPGATAAVT